MVVVSLTVAWPQEKDVLVGQWNCSVREIVKLQTGRIAGNSVSQVVIEFRNDRAFLIPGGPNATWSGTPEKIVVQLDKEARLTGKMSSDFLTMQGDRLSKERDKLTHAEWTCRKPAATPER